LKRLNKILPLFFAILFFVSQRGKAQEVFCLNDSMVEISLLPYYSYFIDNEGNATIEQIRQKENFIRVNKPQYAYFGYTPKPHWLKFSYKTDTISLNDFYVFIETPSLQSVQYYIFSDSSFVLQRNLGTLYKKNKQEIAFRDIAVELPNTEGKTFTVYCRVKSLSSLGLHLKVAQEKKFLEKQLSDTVYLLIGFGIMIALFFFNFILLFLTRERMYLYYALFLLFSMMFLFIITGFSNFIAIHLSLETLKLMRAVTYPLASIFAFLFNIKFLDIKKISLSMYYALIACVVAYFIVLILLLIPSENFTVLAREITVLLFPLGATVQLISGIIAYRKGHKPALYFIVSYIPFIVGTFIHSAILSGKLPLMPYSTHFLITNFSIFAVAITISLTEKVTAINKEKARAAQLLHDNENLETQVALRTEALAKSEEKYRELVHDLYDWVWQMEFGGVFSFCGEGVRYIFGYEPEEILHRNFAEFFPAEEVEHVRNLVFNMPLGENKVRFQSYGFHKNGNKVFVECYFRILRDADGKIHSYRGVTRDVTQQKNIEVMLMNTIIETENKERERFAADMHDELGATLTGLNLYLNALKDERIDNKLKKEILDKSHTVVKQVAEEIRRISHNIKPYELDKYGLIKCIEDFCEQIEISGKIEVEFEYATYKNNLRKEYELILFRVLSELINNTLKYAEATKIRIQIVSRRNKIKISYIDNGKGFDFDITQLDKYQNSGLENIKVRLNSISANVKFHSRKNYGFYTVIEFVV